MIISNKNNIGVSANFDSGTFMSTFTVQSTKNPGYNNSDINIQAVEKLTFEDFTALEIVIGQAVSNFLDMKHRELGLEDEENLHTILSNGFGALNSTSWAEDRK